MGLSVIGGGKAVNKLRRRQQLQHFRKKESGSCPVRLDLELSEVTTASSGSLPEWRSVTDLHPIR